MAKFYTAYDPPPAVNQDNLVPKLDIDGNVVLKDGQPVMVYNDSLTQQHFAEECDINNIVNKYLQSGILGDPLAVASVMPQYGDFSAVTDFHTAQNVIAEATQAFDLLPAELRKRFENDPGNLIDFLNDDSNREEAIRLGLVNNAIEPNQSVGSMGSPTITSTSSIEAK